MQVGDLAWTLTKRVPVLKISDYVYTLASDNPAVFYTIIIADGKLVLSVSLCYSTVCRAFQLVTTAVFDDREYVWHLPRVCRVQCNDLRSDFKSSRV